MVNSGIIYTQKNCSPILLCYISQVPLHYRIWYPGWIPSVSTADTFGILAGYRFQCLPSKRLKAEMKDRDASNQRLGSLRSQIEDATIKEERL